MITIIKKKLIEMLNERKVSLLMIYDINGDILWSYGRNIAGKTIEKGDGFCKSYILESYKKKEWVYKENGVISSIKDDLSKSAISLLIKNVIIQPIGKNYFLYIDSGIEKVFEKNELENFKILGELLTDSIKLVKKKENDIGGIAGNSEIMVKTKEKVVKYSFVDEPILLKGETGTGKNHIAELIHYYSGRTGKYKIIHSPNIPEALFESELFGHKKGAFTDARTDKKGLIAEAEGGTLHIDEITEIPISMQTKLLRFLDTKKYTILGDTKEKYADVRIITSTNKDINKAIKDKTFREDLFYRINTLEIKLPLLKDRKEDIKDLVNEKISFFSGKKIENDIWTALYDYDWPGNIRELFSILKRAGIECKNSISGNDIKQIINENRQEKLNFVENNIIEQIWDRLESGESFWRLVKEPYLERELNKREVKAILQKGLLETNDRYIDLLEIFNLKKNEYKKFMNFLRKNKLN